MVWIAFVEFRYEVKEKNFFNGFLFNHCVTSKLLPLNYGLKNPYEKLIWQ